jgi:ABC-type ATPase involved in cell division
MEKAEVKSLSRSNLLQKEELEKVKVDLGKGEFIYVRQMTGRERDNFEQSLIKEKKNAKGDVVSYDRALGDFRAKLAVVTCCDEEGKALFLPDDYSLLSQNMSAKRLEIIVNAAQKLNAISEEDKEALVKNSNPEPADNSNSGSVEN